MPIADLLGVQFDMQLLLKLSFSVAAVLLVSLAYKFYSSRSVKKNQICGIDSKEPQSGTCGNCKTTLRHQTSKEPSQVGGKHLDNLGEESIANDLPSDTSNDFPPESHQQPADRTEVKFSYPSHEQAECMQTKTLNHQNQPIVATDDLSRVSALSLQEPEDSEKATITGRRSPCFLRKLKKSVIVGRELRRDLEHQGVYSSFHSKAKIKVEDASVVLEGSEDQVLHGKIYEYYVETSSHSVTGPDVKSDQCGSYPSNTRIAKHEGCPSPSSVSPTIKNTLVLQQEAVEDVSSQGTHRLRHPARPLFLRNESYKSAAEESEPSIMFQTSTKQCPASKNAEAISLQTSTNNTSRKLKQNEKAVVMQLPKESFHDAEVECIKTKLDLGNCLETLYLAKKNGEMPVQQAALGVMSDNYLQVLRDPNLYGRLMAGEREQIRRQRMRGRRFVMVADMDPKDWLGNKEGQRAMTEQRSMSSAMSYYEDYKDDWRSLCLIPPEVISKACAICTMDNYLFVAVGCQGTDREMVPSKRVFCFNPLTSIWKEICPMNEARPRCKLAALEGHIYAIGGECLSSVERYDPRQDRWTFVAPLPSDTFAMAHHVTVCCGELFVAGGTLRYMLLRYNPQTNTWRPSLMVGRNDRTADMVAVGRFLYRFDVNPLLGISVYRYHTVARLWYECSSKRLLHCPAFQCVAMDGSIYCISRQFTIRFEADEISPAFSDEDLSVLSGAKGILFPFVLSLPDKKLQQTSV